MISMIFNVQNEFQKNETVKQWNNIASTYDIRNKGDDGISMSKWKSKCFTCQNIRIL